MPSGSEAPIVEKMVKNRLRWFGHVERRPAASGSHAQTRRHSRRRHRAVQRQHRLRASQLRRNPATDQTQQREIDNSKACLRLGAETNVVGRRETWSIRIGEEEKRRKLVWRMKKRECWI